MFLVNPAYVASLPRLCIQMDLLEKGGIYDTLVHAKFGLEHCTSRIWGRAKNRKSTSEYFCYPILKNGANVTCSCHIVSEFHKTFVFSLGFCEIFYMSFCCKFTTDCVSGRISKSANI